MPRGGGVIAEQTYRGEFILAFRAAIVTGITLSQATAWSDFIRSAIDNVVRSDANPVAISFAQASLLTVGGTLLMYVIYKSTPE